MITRLNPQTLPPSAGQSHVVISDAPTTIYLSGQLPVDATGQLTGAGNFREQLRQVLENIDHALGAAQASRHDVVKLTIYVVALDPAVHGPALGELLGDLSRYGHPAATLVSVAGLARPECQVEIDVIAARAGERARERGI